LRARLEYLEAQVQEISSNLANVEVKQEPPDSPDEMEQQAIIEQMARLKLRTKDDRATYFGPNCRYGIVGEYPEIFTLLAHKRHSRDKCPRDTAESDPDIFQDLALSAFPFNVYTGQLDLQAMLPQRSLCDQLVARYFLCSNAIFNVIDQDTFYTEQYPAVWSTPSAPAGHIALVFLMIAIAARSLNPGHPLLPMLSASGQPVALVWARKWRKYGHLAVSQNKLMQRSSLVSIQAVLLLALGTEEDNVRFNSIGLVANMAKIGGLFRDPSKFSDLDDKVSNLRRYDILLIGN
jgi:hypothetical protein